MKKWIAALFALPLSCLQAQTLVNSFDNIQYWVGTGQNRAALVLQWNDGLNPVSLAWGYRWDGAATGIDMLRAIAGSTVVTEPVTEELIETGVGNDTRLRLRLGSHSFGLSVVAIEYESSNSAARLRSDWFDGYWEYFIRGGQFEYTNWGDVDPTLYDVSGSEGYDPSGWFSSPIGAGDRTLIDGAWDAYSFAVPSPDPAIGYISATPTQLHSVSLPLPVLDMALSSREPSLSFSTVSGIRYQLEFSDDLAGVWTELGAPIAGDGQEWTITDRTFADDPARPMGSRFYRLKISQ